MNSSYNFYTDSGQILSPDEFYEKMMTKISQLGTLKNRGEQCRDSELQYEMKQAKCGNKGEFCSSLCSDKLKSKKTVNQDKWDGSSEHKSRGLQGKLDAPCNKSYKTVHEGKSMVKSLPISVGALQGEQKLRISTNEEVRNANQADPSEASLKAGEDRLYSHLDESAIYLAKFEDKLVRRSQNRIRFEQVPDADMLRTEFSEINPEESGTIQELQRSFCENRVDDLQEGCLLYSSFPDGLMNVPVNIKANKKEKKLNSMSNFGEQNGRTVQSRRISVTGEDALDKNAVVDNTMFEREMFSRSAGGCLHRPLEKIADRFDESEVTHVEMCKNNSSSFEGELQTIKRTVQKLVAICQYQQIKLEEFQIGKDLQSLEGKPYSTILRDLFVNFLQDINKQLGILGKEIGDPQETMDGLKQQLAHSETKVIALEKRLEVKAKHIEEINRKMQAVQDMTDRVIMEKSELLSKMQDTQKENKDLKEHIEELVIINEELLVFSRGKEMELDGMKEEIEKIKQSIQIKVAENTVLMQELTDTRKNMEGQKLAEDSIKSRYKSLKSKLVETEYELSQREEALESITKQLSSAIEGQDCLLEEAEHLQRSLKEALYKECELDEQLRQSQNTIQELVDKLTSKDSEISKARTEMADMREENDVMKTTAKWKGQEVSGLQKETVDMRRRVQQLEDEIMEKEGQIAILKSSFPCAFGC